MDIIIRVLKMNKKGKKILWEHWKESDVCEYYRRVEKLLERAMKEELPIKIHIGYSDKIERIHQIGDGPDTGHRR